MNYSLHRDIAVMKKLPLMFQYILILIIEVLKANRQVLHFIMTPKYQVEPQIVHFTSNLKTETARVILANSITLTPGTITVAMEEDELTVHALDVSLVKGIDDSVFVHMLRRMEAIDEKAMEKRRKRHVQ